MALHPKHWMEIHPQGLFCTPANAYIDPVRPVERAIITHGHADHARSGHGTVYATPETLAIMRVRYGDTHCDQENPLSYGDTCTLGSTQLTLQPAGHILGSAQALLDHADRRIVISGDYKRRHNPTCKPFKPAECDVFVTEATFGLPVFTHPPIEQELLKLLHSLTLQTQRTHLVGVYALGKCQRVILGLRALGYDKPLYLHGALRKLCDLYQQFGIEFGELIPVTETDPKTLAGEIVLAPPSALADKWSRKFPDVLPCIASGWMQIRARARQRSVELPLIISDHVDWPELMQTLRDVNAPEVWVTHGREEAVVHAAQAMGYEAQALSLLGYEEDEAA